jgi:3-oxoacyl-[acyl-carrier-protein] synthase-3
MGDGGTATLVEADPSAGAVAMEMLTDGSRFGALYVPAGGFRRPSSDETREVSKRTDGGLRSDDDIFMDGMEIFKFSATDVVKSIAGFMETEGFTAENVRYLYLHQANHFMNEKIAKKLGFAPDQVPYTIGTYGNTGSASIPLTMAHHLSQVAHEDAQGRIVFSGFGVGLSWGVGAADISGIFSPPIVELDE